MVYTIYYGIWRKGCYEELNQVIEAAASRDWKCNFILLGIISSGSIWICGISRQPQQQRLELTTFIESLTGYTTALTYLSLSLIVSLIYIDNIVPWNHQNWEVFHQKTLKSIQPLYKHYLIIYSKTFIYYLLAFVTMITKPVIWFEINRFRNIFQLPSIKIYFTFIWVIINHDYAK